MADDSLFILQELVARWQLSNVAEHRAAAETLHAVLYGLVGADPKLLNELSGRARKAMDRRLAHVGARWARDENGKHARDENGELYVEQEHLPPVNGGALFPRPSHKSEGERFRSRIAHFLRPDERTGKPNPRLAVEVWKGIAFDCPTIRVALPHFDKDRPKDRKAIATAVRKVLHNTAKEDRGLGRTAERVAAEALRALGASVSDVKRFL
jgi:hypothetical protein